MCINVNLANDGSIPWIFSLVNEIKPFAFPFFYYFMKAVGREREGKGREKEEGREMEGQ